MAYLLAAMNRLSFLFAALLALALASCEAPKVEEGVVARVNGRPIFLHQLEAKHDLGRLGWSGHKLPGIGELKGEYGRILSELIVAELISQSLEGSNLAVAEEETAKAEALVRADYPRGGFEQELVEEYIDLAVWRERLKSQLAQQKFLQELVKPLMKVDAKEAKEYYQAHKADFRRPARVKFMLVAGVNRKTVRQAALAYAEERNATSVLRKHPVTIQELRVRDDRLAPGWRDALKDLKPLEASQPTSAGAGEFESLVLLEKIPSSMLDETQAYPQVEKILLERKVRDAFDEWLAQKLHKSTILVSSRLLGEKSVLVEDGEETLIEQPLQPDEGQGLEGEEPKKAPDKPVEAAAETPKKTEEKIAPAAKAVEKPAGKPKSRVESKRRRDQR